MDKTLPQVYQLLRLHVVSAQINNAPESWKTFCVVKVGDNRAQTLQHPLLLGAGGGTTSSGSDSGPDTKEVRWGENFIVEFDSKNENLFMEIQVFAGKDFLGSLRLKVNNLCSPGQDTWDKVQPSDFPLFDAKANNIGSLKLRIRHEFKVFGTLVFNLKEGDLAEDVKDVQSVMAIVKHTDEVFTTPAVDVKDNHFAFGEWSKSFEINEKNNVFDIFVELWEGKPGQRADAQQLGALEPAPTAPIPSKKETLDPRAREGMLGQARLPLFDARSPFQSSLPIFSADHKRIGQFSVQAHILESGKQRGRAEEVATTERIQQEHPTLSTH